MSDAKSQKTKKPINQNLTVPNAMSVFRILVIPFFAYFFLKGNLTAAIVALGLSGLSDALDGMIARRFNQITELGKMLDRALPVHLAAFGAARLKGARHVVRRMLSAEKRQKAVRGKVVRQGLHNTVLYRHRTHRRHGRLYEGFREHVQYRVHHGARHHGGLHGVHVHSIFRRVPRNFEIDRRQIRFEPARRNAGKERAHTEKLTVCAGKENVYDDVYTLQEAACGCVRFPFNGYERHAGLLSCLRKRARH